jgi:hypothetical protein
LAWLELSAHGVKLDSLSTGKVRSFCPGNDAPVSAVVSNASKVDKVGGATLTPTRELQLVSIQRNQPSSAVTPSSHPIQVEKPAFALDIHAPSPKRQCRSFTSPNPYQHVTGKNHSHIGCSQGTHNKPVWKWNTVKNSSMLSTTVTPARSLDPHYTPQELPPTFNSVSRIRRPSRVC